MLRFIFSFITYHDILFIVKSFLFLQNQSVVVAESTNNLYTGFLVGLVDAVVLRRHCLIIDADISIMIDCKQPSLLCVEHNNRFFLKYCS